MGRLLTYYAYLKMIVAKMAFVSLFWRGGVQRTKLGAWHTYTVRQEGFQFALWKIYPV